MRASARVRQGFDTIHAEGNSVSDMSILMAKEKVSKWRVQVARERSERKTSTAKETAGWCLSERRSRDRQRMFEESKPDAPMKSQP